MLFVTVLTLIPEKYSMIKSIVVCSLFSVKFDEKGLEYLKHTYIIFK